MIKFFILMLFFSVRVAGQDKYSEVVKIDSASVDQLYSRAKIFVTNAFKEPKEVTQLTDDAGKTVTAKGIFKVAPHGWPVHTSHVAFQLTIASKEGRYKYEFADVVYHYQSGSATKRFESSLDAEEFKGLTKKQWERVKGDAKETIENLISRLKKQMSVDDSW